MPKVSRTPLKSEDFKRIHSAFLRALSRLQTPHEVEEFLQDFLTISEWKMFLKRLATAEMLIEEKSYVKIRETLKVSNGTITRMQNFLEQHGGGMKKMIKQFQKKK